MDTNLKKNYSTSYKSLARLTKVRNCSISEKAFGHVVVDVRSRLFNYLTHLSLLRSTRNKIKCVFRIILTSKEEEMKNVCNDAFKQIKKDVSKIATTFVFVLCSVKNCKYKEPLKKLRQITKDKAIHNLNESIKNYRKKLLSVDLMLKCYTAFETFMITHVEEMCLMYNTSIIDKNLTILPDHTNYFESDRLCAKLNADGILSYDLDCIALFGADLIITEVSNNMIYYVALKDMFQLFECDNREQLVYKCLIMGTDYNLGIRQIGPSKIKKISNDDILEIVEKCLNKQSINIHDFKDFFRLNVIF